MNESMAAAAKSVEDAVSQAKESFEGLVRTQREQFEKASSQAIKGYEDIASLTRANVDALVQASAIVARGAEEASRQATAFAQSSFEQNVAASKALLAARTMTDLFAVQTNYVQQALEAMVSESTRMRELTLKTASEAAAPINAQFNAVVEKVARPVTA